MSEYQRFISYIYAYDGEIKVKNVGFAKMEVRNGHCRIGVNLKGAYGSSGREGVYAVRRTGDGVEKLRLGEILLNRGNGEFSYVSEEDQVGGTDCRLGDLCGLYMGNAADERFYYTGWDDRSVDMAMLTRPEGEAGAEAAAALESEGTAEESETVEESGSPESAAKAAEEEKAAGSAREQEVEEQAVPEKSEGETEAVRVTEYPPKRCPFYAKRQHSAGRGPESASDSEVPGQETWELLRRVYPKMLSAPGQEAWELLEIHLQDIGRLPRKNWIYGNNSFLIQGYYRYGHLMLAKRESGGKTAYWLGVPGSRDDTEQLLAAMFGFREYLPGNRRRSENFGYWCAEIPLEEEGFSVLTKEKTARL